jgi:hypothetical protein
MNRAHPPATRRKTTYKDVGNADIAGANICLPWWLNARVHPGLLLPIFHFPGLHTFRGCASLLQRPVAEA